MEVRPSGRTVRGLALSGITVLAVAAVPAAASAAVPYPYTTEISYDWFVDEAVATDKNGDGLPDLLGLEDSAPSSVAVSFGRGAARFAPPLVQVNGQFDNLATADLNGDDQIDLVTTSFAAPPLHRIYLATGARYTLTGSFRASGWQGRLAIADFDGDGNADIAERSTDGTDILLHRGTGDGDVQRATITAVDLPPPAFLGSPPFKIRALGAGQVDGDGIADLVASVDDFQTASGPMVTLLGGSSGVFGQVDAETPSLGTRDIALGDLNQDGFDDLVLTAGLTQASGKLRVLWGTGNGTFFNEVATREGRGAGPATIADLDLDGYPDAVAGVEARPGATLALGGPAQPAEFLYSTNLDDYLAPHTRIAVGDFDEDDVPDIAFAHGRRTYVQTNNVPKTWFTSGPDGETHDPTPTFGFSSNVAGVTFECARDAQPWAECASPFTVPQLALGVHEFRVRAVGFTTDPTPAVRTITVLPPLSSEPPVVPDGEADNEPALELSVLRTRIPRSASALVTHGAGGTVRCTADCVVRMRVIAHGSAPRRMGFAGPIGRDKAKLEAGKRGKLTAYPRRRVAAKLLNPTASGSLRVELEFDADPR